jgi:hypothetical protein
MAMGSTIGFRRLAGPSLLAGGGSVRLELLAGGLQLLAGGGSVRLELLAGGLQVPAMLDDGADDVGGARPASPAALAQLGEAVVELGRARGNGGQPHASRYAADRAPPHGQPRPGDRHQGWR